MEDLSLAAKARGFLIHNEDKMALAHTFGQHGVAVAAGFDLLRGDAIALAVAINAFGMAGSDAALVIALAYVILVQSAAWYVKLTPHLFGPAEPVTQTT